MGGVGGTLTGFTWVYLLGAGVTVYRLAKSWRAFVSPQLSPIIRQLAGGVAFFLLVPVGVLLHEFGHMLAAWSTGSLVLGLHYFLYWGYVEYLPAVNSTLLTWYVALAGNVVSLLLGVACIIYAVYSTGPRPGLRVTAMQLGVLQIAQTLIFYPLISLDPAFEGDWDTIYSFGAPMASGATAVIHLLALVLFVLLLRRNETVNWLLGSQRRSREANLSPEPVS